MVRRIRILTVSNYYPPHHGGGYGLCCQWFCDGLAARGHAVTVLTSAPTAGGGSMQEVGPIPVRRDLQSIPPGASPARLFAMTRANAAAVRAAVRVVKPDVVFCFGMDDVGFNTYHAATAGGRPSLSWLGDTWLGQAWRNLRLYDPWVDLAAGGRRRGFGQILKRTVGLAGRAAGLFCGPRVRDLHPVAGLSTFVLDDLRRSGAPVPDGAPVIPVPLNAAFFTPAREPIGHGGSRAPHLRALFVGRMERPKGPDVAVAGLAAAAARGADVRLTFAGLHLDRMRPELEKQSAALGVRDRIDWAGTPPLGDLVSLYRSHDVFLFPSRIVEGLGVVNCEAIACGLPVIGTAHSGSAEVIRDGETGFRVTKDDPEAVGDHLATLHRDRGLLESLSLSATRFATRYHPTPVMDRLEAELLRVAEGGR